MEYTRNELELIVKMGEYVEKDTFELVDVKEYLNAYDISFYEKSIQKGWETFDSKWAKVQLTRSKMIKKQKTGNIQATRKRAHVMITRSLPIKMAKNIEISVHNHVLKNHKLEDYLRNYARKIRSIVYNLSFDNFKNDVLSKKYKYSDIPNLRHDQMCPHGPHAMMKEFLKKKEEEIHKCKLLMDAEKQDSKGIYTCKACRSKATVFQAVQTRSADEPMTIFITCLSCDNRWKE